jgi:hypothetical protein
MFFAGMWAFFSLAVAVNVIASGAATTNRMRLPAGANHRYRRSQPAFNPVFCNA